MGRVLAACLVLQLGLFSGDAIGCPLCVDYGTDPVEPILGTLDVTDDPVAVEVRGDRVYLIANNDYLGEEPPVQELIIADVSDPTAPVQLGALDSPWGRSALDVEAGFAYVCNPSLAKIDVSDPTSPELVGHFDFDQLPGETAKQLDIDGGYAYVITEVQGASGDRIRIFDVSGADPAPLGFVEFTYPMHELVARGSYLYGVGYGGLWVVDVLDPEQPAVVENLSLEFHGVDISVLGDIAVIAVLDRPSVILDITDPTAPAVITEGPSAPRFETSGDLLYYVHASAIRVLDLSDPANPALVGTASGIFPFALDVDGCHVATLNPFLGDELRMVPVHCAEPTSTVEWPGQGPGRGVMRSVPNPSRSPTMLQLGLKGAVSVDVVIHDAAGRSVRRIAVQSPAGSVHWDGRDDRGRRAPPGLYFYHVPGETAAGKVTLVD